MEKRVNVEQLSARLCKALIKRNIIEQLYEPVYAYGMRNLIMKSMVNSVMLVLGILFHAPLFTIAFYFAFSAIRAYYGGYHADSRRWCFLYSNLIFIINIVFARYIFDGLSSRILTLLLFFGTILFDCMDREEKGKNHILSAAKLVFIVYLAALYLGFSELVKASFAAILSGLFLYLLSLWKGH